MERMGLQIGGFQTYRDYNFDEKINQGMHYLPILDTVSPAASANVTQLVEDLFSFLQQIAATEEAEN